MDAKSSLFDKLLLIGINPQQARAEIKRLIRETLKEIEAEKKASNVAEAEIREILLKGVR